MEKEPKDRGRKTSDTLKKPTARTCCDGERGRAKKETKFSWKLRPGIHSVKKVPANNFAWHYKGGNQEQKTTIDTKKKCRARTNQKK